MAYTKEQEKAPSFSYAEITKLLLSDPAKKPQPGPEQEMWSKYRETVGGPTNEPIIIVKEGEPPRVRRDVYKNAIQAVEKQTAGASTAREMLDTVIQMNKGRSAKSPEIERNNVLAVLQARGKAQPISRPVFHEIRGLLDRENGGLSKTGFEKYRDDKEVVAAAREQRASWEKNPEQKAADKAEEQEATKTVVAKGTDVLALLTAKEGEKPIADYKAYRNLVGTADRPGIVDVYHKGGLTENAHSAFKAAADKGDELAQQVLAAAEVHRANFVPPPQKETLNKDNSKLVVELLNRRDTEDKKLSLEDFKRVSHLVNRTSGALTKEAEESAKTAGLTDVLEANEARKEYYAEHVAERAASKAAESTEKNVAQEQEPATLSR